MNPAIILYAGVALIGWAWGTARRNYEHELIGVKHQAGRDLATLFNLLPADFVEANRVTIYRDPKDGCMIADSEEMVKAIATFLAGAPVRAERDA